MHVVAAYSDTEISTLIECPKVISEAPKKDFKSNGAHLQKDMRLISEGVNGDFSVFFRQSTEFPENFSIGLMYHPNDGRESITLLRCNGPHGEYNGKLDPNHPHWDFHVHKATEQAQDAGMKAERNADKVTDYAFFEEAIQYFVKLVNVDRNEAQKHFPDTSSQGILFN